MKDTRTLLAWLVSPHVDKDPEEVGVNIVGIWAVSGGQYISHLAC